MQIVSIQRFGQIWPILAPTPALNSCASERAAKIGLFLAKRAELDDTDTRNTVMSAPRLQ